MTNRTLEKDEIASLEAHGCRAENWENVFVPHDFVDNGAVRTVAFSGNVVLGHYAGNMANNADMPVLQGIENASLHNVSVGDHCRIANARIANTDIGDNVLVDSVSFIGRHGDHPFGNDSFAHVLAEDGARAVPLWRNLTAQMAHLACHYKNHAIGEALKNFAVQDARQLRLSRSVVSAGCRIEDCGRLDNVWLGEGVVLSGVLGLDNCHVEGGPVPARIGGGVQARECIFQAASGTDSGARLERCLVGEGVVLEQDLSATDCLFFANSHFGLCEALGVFAGPYSVSHHRSTLVLACQCSFINFGSGSNSSNHHFKLGPRHGGVLRRGVRCGSLSYIFWPSDVGAFSTVVGRHGEHLDTANFPFSLLLSKGDVSLLIPGVNLFSIGVFRDGVKWRKRDNRHPLPHVRDLVNVSVLSPYVMQAMDKGAALLRRARTAPGDLRHGGAVIPEGRIEPALKLYERALLFYLGRSILDQAMEDSGGKPPDADAFLRTVETATQGPDLSGGAWRDWSGLLISGVEADHILDGLAVGDVETSGELTVLLENAHYNYQRRELSWAARRWLAEYRDLHTDVVGAFVDLWRRTVQFRYECIVKDLGKEFSHEAMYGFGVEENKSAVFRRVRGVATEHEYAKLALAQRDALLAMAERVG